MTNKPEMRKGFKCPI